MRLQPFGTSGAGNEFWVSDVLALGSFAQKIVTVGLSGLYFFKNPTNATNKALAPASAGNLTDLD